MDSLHRTPETLARAIDVAMRRRPADLLIKHARLFNLVTGELTRTDIAISDGIVAALGTGYDGSDILDADGLTAIPGFIDAHCHVESSLVTPYQFEELVLPRGTVAAVCDPHELANVAGTSAIDWFLDCAAGMNMHLEVRLPSCVPALPGESNGATLDATALRPYASRCGLAEFMNVPGILDKDADVLRKLSNHDGFLTDGHAPMLSGDALQAICAAGVANDHEASSLPEALEKLRLGMTVFLRYGSVGRDIEKLWPTLTLTHCAHLCLCTDDRGPREIAEEGHIDAAIRLAVTRGCDPLAVYRAACLTPARHFGWRTRGLIAPGYQADIVLVSDLAQCDVRQVICGGRRVTPDLFASRPSEPSADAFRHSVHLKRPLTAGDFIMPPTTEAIGIHPDSLITERVSLTNPESPHTNTAALIERHGGNGAIGLAQVTGFNLKHGALASTIGHDSHNLCVIGATPEDMAVAANALANCGGGWAVAIDGQVTAREALPLGGLMSDAPVGDILNGLKQLYSAAEATGCTHPAPFIALSFLPLPVIPAARLTLRGYTTV